MSRKEKVTLVRSEDFEAVDQELAEAMTLLDSVNERVSSLLQAAPESEGGGAVQMPPTADAGAVPDRMPKEEG